MNARSHAAVFATLGFALSLLSGCGSSGGGGDSSPSGYTGPTVTLSGTASYDRVPATSHGLDYAGTVSKPIRGATVEVRNAAGTTIYFRTTSDAAGAFSIQAPASMSLQLVALATLGPAGAPNTRIVDNTAADAVYGVALGGTTGTSNETGIDLHADSGWGGSSYTGTREAAPFAILDTIRQGHDLLLSADPTIVFPNAIVGWSTSNSTTSIDTSHYSPDTNRMVILGTADEDTDEFDDHVIAHEWGHWFEANFSRSDSIGGQHGAGNILDETVAFGEGWGNAFSGMVTADPLYFDTMGSQQGSTGVAMDLEADEQNDSDVSGVPTDSRLADGGWSETSVQEILWDVFDSGALDTDADGVALGFTPLYQVFTGAQRTTPGFTTIYSFLDALKTADPGDSGTIAAIAAAENIGLHDAFEETGFGRRRYTDLLPNAVPVTVDVDGETLTTYTTYGPIHSDRYSNKLYNRMLFKATLATPGTYRLRAIPSDGHGDLIIFRGGGLAPTQRDAVFGGSETLDFTASAGQTVTFAVGSFANTTYSTGATPFTIVLGTPATVTKPSPPTPPAAPTSNG